MRLRRIRIASHEPGHEGQEDHEPGTELPARPHPRPGTLALAAGVGLVAAYALLAVVLNVAVDTEAVRRWLAPRASSALNRPVSLGDAQVALLPRPSVRVSDLRVDNLAGFDGPVLASAERIRFDVAWLPLFVGRVRVTRVLLEGPRVFLAIADDGTSNFGDLMPGHSGPAPTVDAPLPLRVREIGVSRGSVTYFDEPGARSLTVAGVEVRARLSPDGVAGWLADVAFHSDSLHARASSVTDEILRMSGPRGTFLARGDDAGRSVGIEEGALTLAGDSLLLSGRLAGLGGARPTYDLQLTNDALDAATLALVVPAGTRSRWIPHFDGQLGLTLQVSGARSPGAHPVIRGAARLDGVSVRLGDRRMVDDVRGEVGIGPDAITLDSLTGTFADGPFEVSGTVGRAVRTVSLVVDARPDLDALDRLELVPAGVTLSGNAELGVSVSGNLDAIDSMGIVGTVVLGGVQAKHPRLGVPLYVPAGELTLSGREVSWEDVDMLVGEDRVLTRGHVVDLLALRADSTVEPQIDVSVRGSRLDLGALLPPDEGELGIPYVRAAMANLGGRRIDGHAGNVLAHGPRKQLHILWQIANVPSEIIRVPGRQFRTVQAHNIYLIGPGAIRLKNQMLPVRRP